MEEDATIMTPIVSNEIKTINKTGSKSSSSIFKLKQSNVFTAGKDIDCNLLNISTVTLITTPLQPVLLLAL